MKTYLNFYLELSSTAVSGKFQKINNYYDLDLDIYFTGTLVINVGHKREGGDLEHN